MRAWRRAVARVAATRCRHAVTFLLGPPVRWWTPLVTHADAVSVFEEDAKKASAASEIAATVIACFRVVNLHSGTDRASRASGTVRRAAGAGGAHGAVVPRRCLWLEWSQRSANCPFMRLSGRTCMLQSVFCSAQTTREGGGDRVRACTGRAAVRYAPSLPLAPLNGAGRRRGSPISGGPVTTSPWWPADAPDTPESRLELLGWDAGWREAFDEHASAGAIPARVSRVDRGACTQPGR